MSRLVMVLLILLLSAARGLAKDYVVMGMGIATCGEFASHYRAEPAATEGDFFIWAQGYMSGINFRPVSCRRGHQEHGFYVS